MDMQVAEKVHVVNYCCVFTSICVQACLCVCLSICMYLYVRTVDRAAGGLLGAARRGSSSSQC